VGFVSAGRCRAELEEAANAEEWNGTIARFMHQMLMIFMAQHPKRDSARDAVGEKLLYLIARGFVPPPHRARKLHRARLDAAVRAGCRTQAEAVEWLMRVLPIPLKGAQGRSYRKMTVSKARSRVRSCHEGWLEACSCPSRWRARTEAAPPKTTKRGFLNKLIPPAW
jgi:hypothetical protein